MKKKRNKYSKSVVATAILASAVIPTIAIALPTVSASELNVNTQTPILHTNVESQIYTTLPTGDGNSIISDTIQTSDGGYLAVGYSAATDVLGGTLGSSDALLFKYNGNGELVWTKKWSHSGVKFDSYKKIDKLSNGTYIIVGVSSNGNASLGITEGVESGTITNVTESGEELWSRGLAGNTWGGIEDVEPTPDGGFIVLGRTSATNLGVSIKGGHDAIVAKYSSQGNREWIQSLGGTGTDIGVKIKTTKDGGYLFVGAIYSADAPVPLKGSKSSFIAKLSTDGNMDWVESYGYDKDFSIYDVEEMDNGGIIAVGSQSSQVLNGGTITNANAFVLTLDSKGKELDFQNIGGRYGDSLNHIHRTEDGEFLAVGNTNSDDFPVYKDGQFKGGVLLLKLTETGDTHWISSLNNPKVFTPTGSRYLGGGDYLISGSVSGSNSKSQGYLSRFSTNDAYNRAPSVGLIGGQTVKVGEDLTLKLSDYFTDKDGDNLTFSVTTSNGANATINGDVLTFKSATEGVYDVTVIANDGVLNSKPLKFVVNVISAGVWTFENPTGSTERLKRNVTVLGGKVVNNLLIEDVEYTQTEIELDTELGKVILKPDGNGNTILNLPNGLGTSKTDTRLKLERDGINFLDIKIKAQPELKFTF